VTRDDHRALLGDGAVPGGGTWADLGSGSGEFTAALAEALGPGAAIWSVDRDARSLRDQERRLRAELPGFALHVVRADFTGPLALPPLDGVLMANSLHLQADQSGTLEHVGGLLAPGGRLIIVEYDISHGSPWVPYPVPWERLSAVAVEAGFGPPRLVATRPSRYHGRAYSAVMLRASAR
jgi:SAM-dependent methyltransferase